MDKTSLSRQSRCLASLLRLAALEKEHVRKNLHACVQQLERLQAAIAEEEQRITGISQIQRVSCAGIAQGKEGAAGHSAQKALAFVSACSCMRIFCELRLRHTCEQGRELRSDVAALGSAFEAQRSRAESLAASVRALSRTRLAAAELLAARDLEDRFSLQYLLRDSSLNKEVL